jgi:TorA-specific chaperone
VTDSQRSNPRRTIVSSEAVTIFAWLSALFAARPTPEVVAAHRRGAASRLLEELSSEPDFAHGVAQMRVSLDAETDDATVAAGLGRQYGLLFDGIGGPRTVPPYESAFRPGAAWRLFQEPVSEMNALLAEHGVSVSSDTPRPSDHLSIELALAAHFAAVSDPSFTEMTKRLAGWVPAFAAHCVEADETGFWGGASLILEAAVSRGNPVLEATETQEEAA